MDEQKDFFNEFIEKDEDTDKSAQVYDSLRLYFKCISAFPVLSKQEEENIAKIIHDKKMELIKQLLYIPFVQKKIYALSNIFSKDPEKAKEILDEEDNIDVEEIKKIFIDK
ncbi:MAG: hypothetical protein ACP5KH_00855 [Thermodesulfovibrio sp.]